MLHVPKLISKSLQTKLLQVTESWVGPGARNDLTRHLLLVVQYSCYQVCVWVYDCPSYHMSLGP